MSLSRVDLEASVRVFFSEFLFFPLRIDRTGCTTVSHVLSSLSQQLSLQFSSSLILELVGKHAPLSLTDLIDESGSSEYAIRNGDNSEVIPVFFADGTATLLPSPVPGNPSSDSLSHLVDLLGIPSSERHVFGFFELKLGGDGLVSCRLIDGGESLRHVVECWGASPLAAFNSSMIIFKELEGPITVFLEEGGTCRLKIPSFATTTEVVDLVCSQHWLNPKDHYLVELRDGEEFVLPPTAIPFDVTQAWEKEKTVGLCRTAKFVLKSSKHQWMSISVYNMEVGAFWKVDVDEHVTASDMLQMLVMRMGKDVWDVCNYQLSVGSGSERETVKLYACPFLMQQRWVGTPKTWILSSRAEPEPWEFRLWMNPVLRVGLSHLLAIRHVEYVNVVVDGVEDALVIPIHLGIRVEAVVFHVESTFGEPFDLFSTFPGGDGPEEKLHWDTPVLTLVYAWMKRGIQGVLAARKVSRECATTLRVLVEDTTRVMRVGVRGKGDAVGVVCDAASSVMTEWEDSTCEMFVENYHGRAWRAPKDTGLSALLRCEKVVLARTSSSYGAQLRERLNSTHRAIEDRKRRQREDLEEERVEAAMMKKMSEGDPQPQQHRGADECTPKDAAGPAEAQGGGATPTTHDGEARAAQSGVEDVCDGDGGEEGRGGDGVPSMVMMDDELCAGGGAQDGGGGVGGMNDEALRAEQRRLEDLEEEERKKTSRIQSVREAELHVFLPDDSYKSLRCTQRTSAAELYEATWKSLGLTPEEAGYCRLYAVEHGRATHLKGEERVLHIYQRWLSAGKQVDVNVQFLFTDELEEGAGDVRGGDGSCVDGDVSGNVIVHFYLEDNSFRLVPLSMSSTSKTICALFQGMFPGDDSDLEVCIVQRSVLERCAGDERLLPIWLRWTREEGLPGDDARGHFLIRSAHQANEVRVYITKSESKILRLTADLCVRDAQTALARSIGIRDPELVRLYHVDSDGAEHALNDGEELMRDVVARLDLANGSSRLAVKEKATPAAQERLMVGVPGEEKPVPITVDATTCAGDLVCALVDRHGLSASGTYHLVMVDPSTRAYTSLEDGEKLLGRPALSVANLRVRRLSMGVLYVHLVDETFQVVNAPKSSTAEHIIQHAVRLKRLPGRAADFNLLEVTAAGRRVMELDEKPFHIQSLWPSAAAMSNKFLLLGSMSTGTIRVLFQNGTFKTMRVSDSDTTHNIRTKAASRAFLGRPGDAGAAGGGGGGRRFFDMYVKEGGGVGDGFRKLGDEEVPLNIQRVWQESNCTLAFVKFELREVQRTALPRAPPPAAAAASAVGRGGTTEKSAVSVVAHQDVADRHHHHRQEAHVDDGAPASATSPRSGAAKATSPRGGATRAEKKDRRLSLWRGSKRKTKEVKKARKPANPTMPRNSQGPSAAGDRGDVHGNGDGGGGGGTRGEPKNVTGWRKRRGADIADTLGGGALGDKVLRTVWTSFINAYLGDSGLRISQVQELCDGKRFLYLAAALFPSDSLHGALPSPTIDASPSTVAEHAMQFAGFLEAKGASVSPTLALNIVAGKLDAILDALWELVDVGIFQPQLGSGAPSLQMLMWVVEHTKKHAKRLSLDMGLSSSAFRNGWVFCALLSHFYEDFQFDSIDSKASARVVLRIAFEFAERKGIPPPCEPEFVKFMDETSMMVYLGLFVDKTKETTRR